MRTKAAHTAHLREISLELILRLSGATADRHDRQKWHTSQGPISICGAKFMNWRCGVGGGGAIDLVMHLQNSRFNDAIRWLEHHSLSHVVASPPASPFASLALPVPEPRNLQRVKEYLVRKRKLPAALLAPLLARGTIYADTRANAVFLLLGKKNIPVGAELRGTTPRQWRGLATGSQKNRGFFYISALRPLESIILCESAIDAISCFVFHPRSCCISTAGVRHNPPWLPPLLQLRCPVYCGFDADSAGDSAAQAMLATYPAIQRLRPTLHDWNDFLLASP